MNIIPENEYADHKGLSQSGAKELLRSPRHFLQYLERDREEQTPAQRIGSLVHMASLQPRLYDEVVAVAPECDRRTKDGKEIWAAFQSSLKDGQTAITQKESEAVISISVAAREALDDLTKQIGAVSSVVEQPMAKRYNGVDIKGRPDIVFELKDGRRLVADIKTTTDAGKPFVKDIANYLYFLQAAWYMELTGADRFVIIAVEKEAPHEWALYELDEASLAKGKALMDSAVALFGQCNAFKSFPGYPKDIQTVSLPAWA
jgi:exodeoxyribonuclease VIII